MEKGEIRINTENIFPIIKKAVYSDHEIFLRELVSNAVDAISKRISEIKFSHLDLHSFNKDKLAIAFYENLMFYKLELFS